VSAVVESLARAPVRRHRLGVVIELEGEDGMAGGDQLVIDFLLVVAEVTGETAGSTDGEVAEIGHPARH